ncbi:MAG: histidine phosphatase family protein [Rhodocyclaceae bacterium]|nr:histidine phosphatase family protein [Rhodocyclaceae bacterium]
MTSPTRICLVRHGETDWNVEKRLQGQLDVPLNAVGRTQARAAAAMLCSESIAAVYSSDLSRAMETAREIAGALGLAVRGTPSLRERRFGVFEGLTQDEARQLDPDGYARYRGREPDYAIPGGESLKQLASRIVASMTDLALAHVGETILLVTHGGVLDIAHRLATAKPLGNQRDFTISNAALNWIAFDAGTWRLLAWDQKPHLDLALDELPG